MELWSDLIPPLIAKFETLRLQARRHSAHAANQAILKQYEILAFDLVEGIHTLFIEMIRNQGYVRKRFPKLELEIYREAHLGMIAALKESLADDVGNLIEFSFQLQQLVQQLRGYCIVLRQDIRYAMDNMPILQKDRKIRQINLQAQQALVAIDLHLSRSKQLADDIAKGQFQNAVDALGEWERDPVVMDQLLAELQFTDSEKAILRGVLGDR